MALTVYKSSAGSGKTFTLVKEYVKLLIANPQDFKHILAITFTNKATEEMKSRILKALQDLASGNFSDLQQVLLSEFDGRFDAQQVASRAEEAYDLIIHQYSRFEVSTIDSFFSRVLKSFARELNLPLSYEVEMNQKLALTETIENLFRTIDQQPEVKEWLTLFSKEQIENDKSWNVDRQIEKLGNNLFSEAFQEGFSGQSVNFSVLKEVIDRLKAQKAKFENTARSFANKAFDLMNQYGLTVNDFNYSRSGPLAAFYALQKEEYDIEHKKRFIQALDGEMKWGAKKSPKFELACQVGEEQLAILGNEALHFILKERKNYNTNRAVLRNIYAFGLLESLNLQLKDYRDEHNVMLISDTNRILKEVLNEADAPFLFEKLGSSYKHIMIDEFQDTSNFQWNNLRPLIINALSEGHEVLIVGDVKQSIYRFRGGNMRLLLSQIRQDLGAFYSADADKRLVDNYRSLSQIVSFNNALFAQLPAALKTNDSLANSELFELAFQDHAQQIKKQQGGFVQVSFWDDDLWKEASVGHLMAKIAQNIELGYSYGDMLVLVNRNSEIPDVANAFLQARVPFINGDSLKLSQSDLVVFVLELLAYLQTDNDDVRLLNLMVLYCRLKGKAYQPVVETRPGERITLQDAGFPPAFFEQMHRLKQQSLFDLICELLIIFDFSNQSDIYLQQLLDLVLEQGQKGRSSVSSFLEWWEKEGDNQTVATSEHANAIRILTIHKSKGLEAPIVFIPFTNWQILPPAQMHQFWTSNTPEDMQELRFIPLDFSKGLLMDSHFADDYLREAEESALDILNKTYVAFTRPREKLYLSAPATRSGGQSIHQLLVDLVEDIGMKTTETDGGTQWELGEEHEKVSGTDSASDAEVLKIYPEDSFLEKLSIRNDSERFFMLQQTEQARKITLGNQVHDVLSDVLMKEDLPVVLRQRVQAGEFNQEIAREVEKRIERLFEEEKLCDWFSGDYEVYNERTLWFEGREHKPDRLMLKGEKAIVVDYKKEVESEAHQQQVKRYMHAIQAMGYSNVSGFLVYVEPVLIREVGV
ncbi:UvrD-helicase domain-containing protein [Roseivirga thermotolerans]|uniref:DNA 3'-5' helicase n=1 Tax=Roseivirga thermotolerans TaxID=1758176 RepID=A0ABQ3IAV4_9BACT|nr:UvrD-helicase domain-containing protein [Roseivirga thermotolerans]GHE71133.1 DNA helicase [Roseivirga thermotolerans]